MRPKHTKKAAHMGDLKEELSTADANKMADVRANVARM
jgi:hypothetical protein